MVSLLNNGTAATQMGDAHIIRIYVDDTETAIFYSKSISIPVGGMNFACAQGINGKNWIAANGTFNITATVETLKKNDLNALNNSCKALLQLPDGKAIPNEIVEILK
jgi:hypothetical protein